MAQSGFKLLLTAFVCTTALMAWMQQSKAQPPLPLCQNAQDENILPFRDVRPDHWAFNALARLSSHCISNASSNGLPDDRADEFSDDLSASDLQSIPTSVTIGDRTYTIDTYLWRDFMPFTSPQGDPLIASVQLRAEDGAPLPSTLTPVKLWVAQGNEVQPMPLDADLRWSPDQTSVEGVARQGPFWSPGTVVDVVVELRDDQGQGYWVRSPDQTINRTD